MNLSEKNKLYFYFYEAKESEYGHEKECYLILFGKIFNKEANDFSEQQYKYINCNLVLKNILQTIYLVPKAKGKNDYFSRKQIEEEFISYNNSKLKIETKIVSLEELKSYCFDQYKSFSNLKCYAISFPYNSKYCNIETKDVFKSFFILGKYSQLETFMLEKRLNSPCWIEIPKNGLIQLKNSKKTNDYFEFEIDEYALFINKVGPYDKDFLKYCIQNNLLREEVNNIRDFSHDNQQKSKDKIVEMVTPDFKALILSVKILNSEKTFFEDQIFSISYQIKSIKIIDQKTRKMEYFSSTNIYNQDDICYENCYSTELDNRQSDVYNIRIIKNTNKEEDIEKDSGSVGFNMSESEKLIDDLNFSFGEKFPNSEDPDSLNLGENKKIQKHIFKEANEVDLIKKFLIDLKNIDPDIIIGYQLNEQLEFLFKRIKTLKISNWTFLSKLRVTQINSVLSFNQKIRHISRFKKFFYGRLTCDILPIIKEINKEVNYDYDYIVEKYLKTNCIKNNHNKIEFSRLENFSNEEEVIYNNYYSHIFQQNEGLFANLYINVKKFSYEKNNFSLLFEETSNIYKLFEEFKIMDISVFLAERTQNLLSNSMNFLISDCCEKLLAHNFYIQNYILPNERRLNFSAELNYSDLLNDNESCNFKNAKNKPTFKGGKVLDPQIGLYTNVVIAFDYVSLYPSIIKEFNICFSTINEITSKILDLDNSKDNEKKVLGNLQKNYIFENEDNIELNCIKEVIFRKLVLTQSNKEKSINFYSSIKHQDNKASTKLNLEQRSISAPRPRNNNPLKIFSQINFNRESIENISLKNLVSKKKVTKASSLRNEQPEFSILPTVISQLMVERRQIKNKIKKISDNFPKLIKLLSYKEKILKKIANSIYGYLAYENSRFYSITIASLITCIGRKILNNTNKFFSDFKDKDVIYGDTDSVLVNMHINGDCNLARKNAELLKNFINEKFQFIKIEIDSIYKRFILYNKKQYAGLKFLFSKIKGEMQYEITIKGLELSKSDSPNLCKIISHEVFKILLYGNINDRSVFENALKNLFKEFYRNLFINSIEYNMDFPLVLTETNYFQLKNFSLEDFEIKKNICRPLCEYDQAFYNSYPHIYLARRLIENKLFNYEMYDAISYIVGGEIIIKSKTKQKYFSNKADDFYKRIYHKKEFYNNKRLEIDREYYFYKKVIPMLFKILHPTKFIGLNKENDLLKYFGLEEKQITYQKAFSRTISHTKSKECCDSGGSKKKPFLKTKFGMDINCSYCFSKLETINTIDSEYNHFSIIGLLDCSYCEHTSDINTGILFNKVVLIFKKVLSEYHRVVKECSNSFCQYKTRMFLFKK